MNVYRVGRGVLLSALVAFALLAGMLLMAAPKASAALGDCPVGKICLWSGSVFDGQASFFDGSDQGFKTLANIDPQSAYNHTGNHIAVFGGVGLLPGEVRQFSPPWTDGFTIN